MYAWKQATRGSDEGIAGHGDDPKRAWGEPRGDEPKRKGEGKARYAYRLHAALTGAVCLLAGITLLPSMTRVRQYDGVLDFWAGQVDRLLANGGANIVPMPRVKKGALTPLEFFEKYGDMPAIIEGALDEQPFMKRNMDFQSIADLCGDSYMETVVYDKSFSGWGGHQDAKMMLLKDYVETYILSNSTTDEIRYATSGSYGMPNLCPLLQNYMFVANVVSSPLPLEQSYVNTAQPAMFLGSVNTKTELHRDYSLLPFWFNLYLGSKAFRVIRFEDSSAYLGDTEGSRYTKVVFNKDLNQLNEQHLEIWEPDLNVFPELSKVPIYEGTMYAGDLMYVPSGALHGAMNKENSFGDSENELYAPVVWHYVDVCFESGFAEGCNKILANSFPECPLTNRTTANTFNRCVQKSELQQDAMQLYGENVGYKADIPLYRYSHKDSYESWCAVGCEYNRLCAKEVLYESPEADAYKALLQYHYELCTRQCTGSL